MNLVLLFAEDFIAAGQVKLCGRRRDHIASVLKSRPGDQLGVGLCNGKMGQGQIIDVGETIVLNVTLDQDPPPPLPLTLILALPRPHIFKRTLAFAAALGIKKMIILSFARVEQGLWNSSSLKSDVIKEQLCLGLEQGKDTMMPQVTVKDRFSPFVQDELPAVMKGTLPLVAHPGTGTPCPQGLKIPATLVIGPEGGILPYELEQLINLGFKTIDLGPRILRADTALPFVVGKIYI